MFITFEGVEGAGKGTAISLLKDWLSATGKDFMLTREPGGCSLGENLRALLLDARNSNLDPKAELFMYLADRAQHVAEVIRPALAKGQIVISDRYADSTIVYQGYGRGLDCDELYHLNDLAVGGLWPDLTIVLDLDSAIGLERARSRNLSLGMDIKEGRFEGEALSFHEKVRHGYKEWANRHPERIVIINADGTALEVFSRVQAQLIKIFR